LAPKFEEVGYSRALDARPFEPVSGLVSEAWRSEPIALIGAAKKIVATLLEHGVVSVSGCVGAHKTEMEIPKSPIAQLAGS
jgi:hypothetical protein